MIIKVLFLKLIPGAYNKSRFGVIYIVTFRGTRMRIEKMKKKKRKSIEAITGQVPFLSSNSAKHQIKELIYIQYRTRVPNIQIISREKKEKKSWHPAWRHLAVLCWPHVLQRAGGPDNTARFQSLSPAPRNTSPPIPRYTCGRSSARYLDEMLLEIIIHRGKERQHPCAGVGKVWLKKKKRSRFVYHFGWWLISRYLFPAVLFPKCPDLIIESLTRATY